MFFRTGILPSGTKQEGRYRAGKAVDGEKSDGIGLIHPARKKSDDIGQIRNRSGNTCTVLIDDLAETIRVWKEQGGTGILHTDPESTLKELKEMGIL